MLTQWEKSILFVIILVSYNVKSDSQSTISIFLDSNSDQFYDYSWMEVTSPGELFRLGDELRKFPVTPDVKFQGNNCLLLRWRSMNGGNWSAIAATTNWLPKDLSGSACLSFYISTASTVKPADLPNVFFEDTGNNKTSGISLSAFVEDTVKAEKWTHVLVPMDTFFNSPQTIDFTKVKTIGFSQDLADGNEHILYIDNVNVLIEINTGPLSIPQGISANGYDSHVFLTWNRNPENYCDGYRIYSSVNGSQFTFRRYLPFEDTCFTDFTGELGKNLNLKYRITAVNNSGNESDSSDIVITNTHEMTDDELLTMVQEATFRYYWEFAHPVSGMSREASDQDLDICATGGSGFGVMAILVGIERGFISRTQGLQQINKIVDFLGSADRFHGVWPHWINGNTGKVIPFGTKDNGGDLVETAYMIEGLLAARQYFNQSDSLESALNEKITALWEGVEWDWYTKNNSNVLYWHWSPNYNWEMNMPIIGFNETLIVYILAVASPTHPVSASLYHSGWASSNYLNGSTFYGYLLPVGPDNTGPLFWTHYSFLGFDPRYKKDTYTNYFLNNVNWALIQRAYSISNPKGFDGYGFNCWGLTASYDPITGYMAHDPNNDNGTISPTAAVSSIPYTPEYSIDAVKHFYRDLGDKIWGNMGFTDAFNLSGGWHASGYISIDQGPIIDMIENYRTGLLWKNFMANPEIQPALDKIGFIADSSQSLGSIQVNDPTRQNVLIFPNPAQSEVNIELYVEKDERTSVALYDESGKMTDLLIDNQLLISGINSFQITLNKFIPGNYFLQIKTEKKSTYERLIISK